MWRDVDDDERKILLKKLIPWTNALKVIFVLFLLITLPITLMAWKFLLLAIPIIFICLKLKTNPIITLPIGIIIVVIFAMILGITEEAKVVGILWSFLFFIWLGMKTMTSKIENIKKRKNGNLRNENIKDKKTW